MTHGICGDMDPDGAGGQVGDMVRDGIPDGRGDLHWADIDMLTVLLVEADVSGQMQDGLHPLGLAEAIMQVGLSLIVSATDITALPVLRALHRQQVITVSIMALLILAPCLHAAHCLPEPDIRSTVPVIE